MNLDFPDTNGKIKKKQQRKKTNKQKEAITSRKNFMTLLITSLHKTIKAIIYKVAYFTEKT